jgi:hypothetical protein
MSKININDLPLDNQSELREITRRELALGALSKSTYNGDPGVIRYMENGQVVSFDVFCRDSYLNWEFYLNGDKNHRIWFSQLDGVYLFREGNSAYSCRLRLKSSPTGEAIIKFSPGEFWEKVRGKQFRVSVTSDMYQIDRWHKKCQGKKYLQLVREICTALDEGRYSDVEGMTKPKPLYMLTEV